jgi:hypothetical protein
MSNEVRKLWTTARGTDCAYLLRDGFYAAKSCGVVSQGLDDMQKLADQLNELEALRESHAELFSALDALTLVVGLTPIFGNKDALQESFDNARAIIRRAQSINKPHKTPAASS